MRGTISKESGVLLPDILQMFSQNGQSGCLELIDPSDQSHCFINLKDGQVINARCGGDQDEDAVKSAITARRWDFEFKTELQDDDVRMTITVNDLLIACAVAIDEDGPSGESSDETYFTVAEDQISGVEDEEQAEEVMQEVNYLDYHAKRIGESLGMSAVSKAGFHDPDYILAYQWVSREKRGVLTKKATNLSQAFNLL